MGVRFRQAMVRWQGWEIHEGHEGARRVGEGGDCRGVAPTGYGQMAGLGDPRRARRGTKGREGGDCRGVVPTGYGQMAGLGDPRRARRGTKGREGGDCRGVVPSVDGRGGRGWEWEGRCVQKGVNSADYCADLRAVQAVCHSIGESLWVGYIFPAVTMESSVWSTRRAASSISWWVVKRPKLKRMEASLRVGGEADGA